MGFQEKTGVTTVFAKLTDLGKKYLLTDATRFQISKFSPHDDEIDYSLWNPDHNNGNTYYGAAIEALPLLEPVNSAIFQAKYNLIKDMDRGILRMPIFLLSHSSITLPEWDSHEQLTVQIQNIDEPQVKVILLDNTIADINADNATAIDVNPLAVQNFIGQSGFSYAKAFICPTSAAIKVTAQLNQGPDTKTTKIIIIGTTTNARSEVTVNVNKNDEYQL
jgi:hypothetical protein